MDKKKAIEQEKKKLAIARGQRIEKIIEDKKISLISLANAVGITYQSLQKIISGDTLNPRNLLEISKVLGVSEEYIRFGRERSFEETDTFPRAVPLISWVRAGKKCMPSEDIDYESNDKVWSGAPVSKNAYALRVVGDSMQNDSGRDSFPESAIIIVDPDIFPENGDYVIAAFSDGSVTFKKLIIDGRRIFLQPLNLNPPHKIEEITNQEVKICGVIKQGITYTRR